ncbi:1-(5-phosphoribosyl)-5-[(5-phosphoribosylamino)methylideneamino]imidazole-4-carboxamide isomerase [Thermomonas carbonis]|uniref:1-(5-phosphoribosyl)-5-[(5-phosphoribosylamino)methylideneamino] imidazole-4-carboxamide isomerase n=1 Tax=Thermomonas carbonis TaxID=1463158 RepID=A0A7G9SPR9_9GAMM|nr:1-(5-phosphoribosyl)-5-[(5-phosphoribosylamino)methylideneamino]imidazole-4-carboxamide isomerase [Thermomonas carbonis]QNN69844.1 1-(5-phosphoribosyl)-5-[(5-phosphoribosylamino)methylideneamino]imidazole-4-carboxamide isomerase [Thermomonas carbonis]GHB95865.1 1-(5-phosphoribosyl)-5-[(5-phosphoribosylamino) methylideneamino] imidazole-4-carboxamide isomerase [Thermomonas carbonis]
MSFTVYPAIDVREGRVVRLRQGDYAEETRYGDDPFAFAKRHADAGATWLHLVDLDAAKAGGYTLLPLLRDIAVCKGLQVQTGGGIRSRDDVAALLDAGASRVVIGSLAVRDPASVLAWIGEFGSERITVALDTRRDGDGVWRLPVHGWTETASETLDDLLRRYADGGLRHLLCTDIERDGMLSGPNIGLYRDISAAHPGLQLQASGGVRDVADVIAARDAGCSGAVLGKALLEGRLSLPEALQC